MTALDLQRDFQDFLSDGWSIITDDGFVGLVGPFFFREGENGLRFCFPTQQKHSNRNGFCQGGALITFADRALGIATRAATGASRTATLQLDVHFIDSVKLGEVVELAPEVVRATKQIVFLTARLTVGTRTVALANGVWKRLADAIPPSGEAAPNKLV
ncbi:uncharacterized protein (TIGR00369 family) [Mesorhizobium sp. J18]|uniref:PaaI family thioesterase n=1 Tax=Mesorhizobium sp. J18 TaxID=935263 RepID=UPI00119AE61E|nr:PaaI family thioesterase [Mesorhizobium sp. J18]TWG92126.1 uncharacterized protein (TIGR00369 family) [Mesorhizobium sp. J18]